VQYKLQTRSQQTFGQFPRTDAADSQFADASISGVRYRRYIVSVPAQTLVHRGAVAPRLRVNSPSLAHETSCDIGGLIPGRQSWLRLSIHLKIRWIDLGNIRIWRLYDYKCDLTRVGNSSVTNLDESLQIVHRLYLLCCYSMGIEVACTLFYFALL